MKPFVRLCHVCRVFLIIGIAGLFSLIAITGVSLSHPAVAHAGGGGDCPNNWYLDYTGTCRPNNFCPTGQYILQRSESGTRCATNNTKSCFPFFTHSDPDSPGCLSNDKVCGSASHLSSDGTYCIVDQNYTYSPPSNTFFRAVPLRNADVVTNPDDNCDGP